MKSLLFPDLGPNLFTLHSGKPSENMLLYQLPDNYIEGQTYPVFLYLPGGTGGLNPSAALARGRDLVNKKNYIVVSLPLFRRGPINLEETFEGVHIGPDDFAVISEAYEVMLKKFFENVKAAKPAGNVMGGFSNGAHTISTLVEGDSEWILSRFQNFFIVDGGYYLSGLYRKRMKDYRFLGLYGDSGGGEDWARPVAISYFKNLGVIGSNYELDFRLIRMRRVGHEFPSRYDNPVLRWMDEVSGLSREEG